MNYSIKRFSLLVILNLLVLQATNAELTQDQAQCGATSVTSIVIINDSRTCNVPEETPFKKATVALDEMIKSISPQTNALNQIEQQLKKHCMSAATETNDYSSLVLLMRLKGTFISLFTTVVEPVKSFLRQVNQSEVLGTPSRMAAQSGKDVIDATINPVVSPEITARIDGLFQRLFKVDLETGVLSLVYAACDITEAQLTQEELAELKKLANSFGALARYNVARTLSVKELDELAKFCATPLFDKLRSNLPVIAQTIIASFSMDQKAKFRIYKLVLKACA